MVVAMSGGVDSSVAAGLLKKQGFEVIGVFMRLWSPKTLNDTNKNTNFHEIENRCCNLEAMEGARRVAAQLRIPFYTIDLVEEFKKYVVDYYIKEYANCRTPNPCVICNKFIKFDFLLKKAFSLGADYLATGHYVRIGSVLPSLLRRTPPSARSASLRSPWCPLISSGARKKVLPNKARQVLMRDEGKHLALLTAIDKTKDQSYFLWTLTQKQLRHLLFPIGDYTKLKVRKMAKKWGLPTADRAESQGLCFIGYWDNREFLEKFVKPKPGPIKDLKGNVLGEHKGLPFYTVGQRKGLPQLRIENLKLKIQRGETPPLYVLKLDQKNNTLIMGEEKDLYRKELEVGEVNWLQPAISNQQIVTRCQAKIRYGHPVIPCRLLLIANRKIKVTFEKPVRAITPGQSIVFYKGGEILGGGIIQ